MVITRRIKRAKRERIVGYTRVAGKRLKVTETKTRYRYRLREPRGKIRTLEIGKPKRHQIIRQKPDGWQTQAITVEKRLVKKPLKPRGRTREIIERAVKYQ